MMKTPEGNRSHGNLNSHTPIDSMEHQGIMDNYIFHELQPYAVVCGSDC